MNLLCVCVYVSNIYIYYKFKHSHVLFLYVGNGLGERTNNQLCPNHKTRICFFSILQFT